jgi:CheY-like chemotaxis protein
MVEEAGFYTVSANNGSKALDILRTKKELPAMIISDIEMPVMDGWALLAYVKSDARYRQIPFVISTSINSDESIARGFNMGAHGYLTKPFGKELLLKNLECLAASRKH